MKKTKVKNISVKRVGLTEGFILSNLRNSIDIRFEGKTYKVGSRLKGKTVEGLCESELFNVSVRG